MIRILIGDEPYWIHCEIQKMIHQIENPEVNLMRGDKLTEAVYTFLNSFAFLPGKKAAVITLSDLSEADTPDFASFQCPEENILIIRAYEYDAKKTFYKEMKKKGYITLCSKSTVGKKLESFIRKKAEEKGVTFTDDAFKELLMRENYLEAEEVTCYSILADLDSLAAVSEGSVTTELVERIVEEHYKGNPFVVAEMISTGNIRGLLEQAHCLSGQEIPALAALLREYRIAWKSCFFKLKDIGVTRKSLSLDRVEAQKGIRIITEALRRMKSDAPKESLLAETYLSLAKRSI